MNAMQTIELSALLIMLLPIALVAYFYYRWTAQAYEVISSTLRMIIQLLLVGFVLTYIFTINNWLLGFGILLFMMFTASWIVLRSTRSKTLKHYIKIFITIALVGTLHLLLVLYLVLDLHPLYQPKYIIPLAGMIYANTMNALSLFIERFESESEKNNFEEARAKSFKAAMIPRINTFLAVGLVSLPGMMTGQILSGIDPLIAVRYQIVVMAMILGSAGSSIIVYLLLKR